jgi:hypothetical protein
MVEQIIAGSDRSEHAADAGFALIKKRYGHTFYLRWVSRIGARDAE